MAIIVTKTPNGENPLVHGVPPAARMRRLGAFLLTSDLHPTYIDYRDRRPDYLKAFVDHLVNWEYVTELLQGE
jgi:superoxide dismutase, Fe-Mn family